jgi:glycerophosphoryl diester phosphodiesterase
LVYEQIFKYISLNRVTLQSFDFNVLKHLHQQIKAGKYKKIQLSALIEPTDNNEVQYNLQKLGFQPEIWSPYFATLTPARVKELHNLGIKVIPWTVNKREDMEKVKNWACDGLITDYPNRSQGL